MMNDKVEIAYESDGYWKLTVTNSIFGTQTVPLPSDIAMTVAMAIATLNNLNKQDESVKKKKNA